MRIVDVSAVHPESPGCPPDWRTHMGQILVAVKTDTGLTGYGVGGGGAAGVHVVQTVLRDVLLGEDPGQIDDLWEQMYRCTLPFGRKGLAIMAISGVDLALWDLRGQVEGKPVVELLGGNCGKPIPTYTTVFLENDSVPSLPQSPQGVKLLAGKSDRSCTEWLVPLVGRVRDEIGPDRLLMVDAFMNWDVPTTLRLANELARYDVAWIEEPLMPDDFEGYARLSGRCPIPIAGGEHEFTARGFQEIIERRLH